MTKTSPKATLEDFRKPWLIQRLDKPREAPKGALAALGDSPFAFGGGMRNGGLSAEAMDLLRPHFSFHYMGSAEFEFGEVPRAFQRVGKHAEAGDLVVRELKIKLNDVEPDWDERIRNRRGKASWPKVEGEATVWVLAPEAWQAPIEEFIREDAGGKRELKAWTGLSNALRPSKDWHGETAGWLELDRGWMFFTDKAMLDGVCGLFGVES